MHDPLLGGFVELRLGGLEASFCSFSILRFDRFKGLLRPGLDFRLGDAVSQIAHLVLAQSLGGRGIIWHGGFSSFLERFLADAPDFVDTFRNIPKRNVDRHQLFEEFECLGGIIIFHM